MRAFEQDLMSNKVTVQLIEANWFRPKVKSRDDAMVFSANISINNGIELRG